MNGSLALYVCVKSYNSHCRPGDTVELIHHNGEFVSEDLNIVLSRDVVESHFRFLAKVDTQVSDELIETTA